MYSVDTITAISTAGGIGAIGIIRISGEEAHRIANMIFRGKTRFEDLESGTITYGKIHDFETEK